MLFSSDGIKWAYQFQFEHEQQKFVKPTVKHSAHVMIWASMSRKGAGSVHFVDGTMESGQYIRILADHLKSDGQRLCGNNWIFQSDNDPKHTSKATKRWIKENKIKTIKWPSNSPDLNPIEHLFHCLKDALRLRKITTIPDLKTAILEEWQKVGQEYCEALVDSMPRRIDELKKAKGGHTSY
ncbi:MAG: putative Transposable element Tcb1 transposase [Streblomastix strix]|uniref:Putative Transposable element Tcb1 transposase n=1 Tax=Streblomastix strix TaxID=222440 RepID=A0A5J4WY45_9EUKA|nr:MAG: putative Transposable element Tcb1 transposase [Streblomastix strix]